ncbi:uncharacterized protein PITG_12261 [Phytophthora infestans T30-4]|uniref:PH domain-containing protein n=2 Tax=Phytophthora infestans TaxID=4787 RepID=D0NJF4_PHYIT|nr:uncharacterized protein PITG_12261 [Phytophthora infestans T30-4]EEY59672.1 conserved hypothetical protein [Phytophthora infestans T30-4]KAF4041307.1 hypothetical protein GN244_ATG06484 [Phytophthora infestans]KAF4149713.1 hypothetical protein GN958_ATG01109 [Phytophthora infestans]KAI9999185.1 hypothetical protein PInf_004004 [Phytophthora infestans]|eukprot:XP_002900865.1 conserved hypothetical protein [Phytophthora infestans T30-4]
MECPPTKYSMFSQQFFVAGSRESLGLRRARATFMDPRTPRISDELYPRGETFCCAKAAASPRDIRQSRDSFLSSVSTASSSRISSPLPQDIRIQGWMYWARREDSTAQEAERYTKVYAVLRNEFLLLYRNDQRPSKKVRPLPLVQIAVASSWRGVDGVLHVEDPYGEEMELHLYERQDFEMSRRWGDALEQASELTHAHFSNFDVKVEDLSRGSVYRGTLHDFRMTRESSIRKSVTQITKFTSWNSLRKFIPNRISSRMKYSRSSSPN